MTDLLDIQAPAPAPSSVRKRATHVRRTGKGTAKAKFDPIFPDLRRIASVIEAHPGIHGTSKIAKMAAVSADRTDAALGFLALRGIIRCQRGNFDTAKYFPVQHGTD